jgi:alkylhydroperoxidase family enzyme
MAVGKELTQQILDDYESAPIDEKLRSTLGLLRKLTLTPDAITAADVRAVMAHGVSKEAIGDAFNVCFLFNIYDRLADTFGWEVPSEAAFNAGAKRLLGRGYR